MEKAYNLVELFSGIGSQAKSLKNIKCNVKTVATCEWDIHAFVAYDAIHSSTEILPEATGMSKEDILDFLSKFTLSNNGKEKMEYKTLKSYSEESLKRIYSAIIRNNNLIDISSVKGENMPDNIDILTYSFPCQDLSNVGAFHGYNKGIDRDSGSRSSLLWQVGRILNEMKSGQIALPKYLLLENVPTLLSPRHIDNFNIWIEELSELGYKSKYFRLNAHEFGLPQNRPRLLMVSFYAGGDPDKSALFDEFFLNKTPEDVVNEYVESQYYRKIEMKELFRTDYRNKKLLAEAIECTPNDTVSRRTIWEENPQLVLKNRKINPMYNMIRTITTKQDRNPNSGNLYFDCGIEGRGKFRYLTPRECFLFMGFTDEDFDNVVAENPEIHKNTKLFPRDKLIRMAGNSIPVKLLEGIFLQIKKFDEQF